MRILAAFALLLCSTPAWAQARSRFAPVDVIIAPLTNSLAAYQVEIVVHGPAQIVGIEGGEHVAFQAAPYYDPAALNRNRVIIAAFSTGRDLPSLSSRVATLHIRQPDSADISYDAKLITAADAAGTRIEANVSVRPHQGEIP